MEWSEILKWAAGIAITALGGTAIGAIASWLKTQKWVRKLHIEGVIDKAAEMALHLAEGLGRAWTNADKGTEKMNIAKKAFETELKKQGIKLDAGDMSKRLESLFNKLKPEVEAHKEIKKAS